MLEKIMRRFFVFAVILSLMPVSFVNADNNNTWYCTNCGQEWKNEANFCGNCGTPRKKTENKNDSAETIPLSSSGLTLADGSFTMRNGVQFGMKLSQIEKIESFKRIKGTLDNIYAYGYGTVSGIKDSSVEYHFDRSGGLKSLEIDFSQNNKNRSKVVIQGEYETISSQLKTKYGKPLGNRNGETHFLQGNEFKSFVGNYSVWSLVGAKLVYEEWLIELSTGSVKIDHLCLTGSSRNSHILEYTYFSKSEINNMFNDL